MDRNRNHTMILDLRGIESSILRLSYDLLSYPATNPLELPVYRAIVAVLGSGPCSPYNKHIRGSSHDTACTTFLAVLVNPCSVGYRNNSFPYLHA